MPAVFTWSKTHGFKAGAPTPHQPLSRISTRSLPLSFGLKKGKVVGKQDGVVFQQSTLGAGNNDNYGYS